MLNMPQKHSRPNCQQFQYKKSVFFIMKKQTRSFYKNFDDLHSRVVYLKSVLEELEKGI